MASGWERAAREDRLALSAAWDENVRLRSALRVLLTQNATLETLLSQAVSSPTGAQREAKRRRREVRGRLHELLAAEGVATAAPRPQEEMDG